MRLSLRFIVPLGIALAAIAYAVVPLVDRLTLKWFVQDLERRSALIANTMQEPCADLLHEHSRLKRSRYFDRVIRDERVFAIGFPPSGLALAGTVMVHTAVAGMLFARPTGRSGPPPVYAVHLVAAPAASPEARRAPEVVERPAAERPAPTVARKLPPRRTSVAKEAPPPTPRSSELEPAPRTTPAEEPLPGVQPSTGTDVASVSLPGVAFAYPEYLRNIVSEVFRRWHRPVGETPLQAEVMFFIRRDGSISNLQFIKRSGSFAFDLEAQGAIEAAGNAKAFGTLPEGYDADMLPVSFFFNPASVR